MIKSKGILSSLQKNILISLQGVPDFSYFYLTGGTALADFYLGHRRSYDLDIFTRETGIVLPFSRLVEVKLKNQGYLVEVKRRFESFVEFELTEKNEKTRLQLALDSPFKFEDAVDSDIGVKVNSYKDLIVDKLLAFFGRVEPRDAVDLFIILKKEKLWELARLAQQKDPGFDLYWLAVALEKTQGFPDDLERWPVEIIIDIRGDDIKKEFLLLSKEILDKLKRK